MPVELQSPPPSQASVANAKLVINRAEALRLLKGQIERGLEIKRAKIRYVPELERARAAKGEWTTATMTLLKGMFNTSAVSDDCQNWVGKVLPEYADLNLFIEHFYDEMDQRLRKLHVVWKRVQEQGDEPAKAIATPAAGAPAPTNPDFFDAPPPAAAAAAGGKASPQNMSTQRPKAGAFVVYEHDPRAQAAVRDFCKKLGFEVVEIAADAGSPIVDQLDQQAHLDFGLIIAKPGEAPKPFELGYFVGRLGLKKVFVLAPSDDKLAVDEHGLLHIPLDPADGWQLHLARQLKRAGLEIDLNRVF
jgi:hypothetical protein